ncbi:MAG: T9SS type A sorting domain-containing protein, partial [Bacteroidota bacterium]
SEFVLNKTKRSLSNPYAFVHHQKSDELLWLDLTTRSIVRGGVEGDDFLYEPLDTTAVPVDLVLDPLNEQLYWLDHGGRRIHRQGVNEAVSQAIVSDGLRSPTSLAVSPRHDLLFWADADSRKIFSSDLNGDKIQELLVMEEGHAVRLAVNESRRELIWSDDVSGRIGAVAFDGTSERQLYACGQACHPFGLFVDDKGDQLYWTDYVRGSIYRLDLVSLSNEEILSGFDEPLDVLIVERPQSEDRMGAKENAEVALSIFPNPSKGQLSIRFQGPLAEDGQLQIYNRNGQLIRSLAMTDSSLALDTSGLSGGWYLCTYRNAHHFLQCQFVVLP